MAEQYGKMEEGLLTAMRAIDNQIARAMQRSPAQRDVHGVQKWEPYATRVEQITAFVLEELGSDSVTLDGLLVLSQAFTKALALAVSDLGGDGLGTTRAAYCLDAVEKIERDALEVSRTLAAERLV